ncbi:MAG: hypothetical protein ABIT01_04820 [Thermoanaerobaculia bacterium]
MTDDKSESQAKSSQTKNRLDPPLDSAAMWENLCLADELSEDCLALEAGLAAQVIENARSDT